MSVEEKMMFQSLKKVINLQHLKIVYKKRI